MDSEADRTVPLDTKINNDNCIFIEIKKTYNNNIKHKKYAHVQTCIDAF